MEADIIIKKSKIEGMGVFANRDFKRGEIVIKWNTDTFLSKKEAGHIPEREKRYIYPIGNRFLLQQPPARYVNHSCNPNTKVVDDASDVAIKDIRKGEEITSDYSLSFAPDEKMECNCGSRNCKGMILKK